MLQAWKFTTLESVALSEKKFLDKHWYQILGANEKKLIPYHEALEHESMLLMPVW